MDDSDRFDVPAIHVNSWYDYGAAETLDQFNLLQKNAQSARGRDNQFVIISPTTHCLSEEASEATVVGDRPVGDARLDYWKIAVTLRYPSDAGNVRCSLCNTVTPTRCVVLHTRVTSQVQVVTTTARGCMRQASRPRGAVYS